jgi:hypothetical protein
MPILKSGLRDLREEEDAVEQLASEVPASWRDAVGAYIAARRAKLVQNIERISEFEVRTRSYQIEALGKLKSIIQPLDSKVQLKDVTSDVSRDERMLRLARVLTPDGWDDKMLDPIRKAEQRAIEALLERKEIPQNQGLLDELRRLLSFLNRVQRDASVAAARRHKQKRAVNGR